MQGKQGAIVAIEPQSGEVLALVSSPSFDPAARWEELGENYRRTANKRKQTALRSCDYGYLSPGSTFKVTQADDIFCTTGVITPYTRYSCYGGYLVAG